MPSSTTPGAVLANNIAAQRGRRRLNRTDLAERMRALGWKWVRQTVAEIEGNRRRLQVEELIGLGIALEVDVALLLLPAPGEPHIIRLPAGQLLWLPQQHEVKLTSEIAESVLWDGNKPKLTIPGQVAGDA